MRTTLEEELAVEILELTNEERARLFELLIGAGREDCGQAESESAGACVR